MAVGGGSGAGGNSGAVRAGAAFVELFTNDSKLKKGLESARRQVAAYGAAMQRAGAVAAGAFGGALFTTAFKAIDTLNDTAALSATAKAFGLTAQEASRTFGIMKAGGSDLRDATEGLVTFGQRVEEALAGKGEVAADLFKQLGVGAEQFAGLNPAQQFDKVMTAIRGVEDPAARVNLLMKAFGEDTGKNLLKLLAKTPDELARLGASFELSAEDMAKADAAAAAYSDAVAGVGAAWQQVAVALAPTLATVGQQFATATAAATAFLKQNHGLVVGAAAATAAVAAGGAAVFGLGATLSVAALAAGKLAAGVALVASPVGLVAAGVGGLGYLFATQTESGRHYTAALGTAFAELKDTATSAWSGITAALGSGDLVLAGRTAMAGLTAAWAGAVAEMQVVWAGFNVAVLDAFREGSDNLAHEFARLGVLIDRHLGKKKVDTVRSLYDRLPVVMGVRLGDVFGIGDAILGASEAGPGVTQTLAEDAARAKIARESGRMAGVLAAQAAVDAAKTELARLVAEARGKAGWGDAGGEWGKERKQMTAQFAGLDKTIGTFLGGASATQVFGQGGGGLQQKMLAAENKQVELLREQNAKLAQLIGKAVPLTFN